MEESLAIIAVFGTMMFVAWAIMQTIVRWREISRETRIMTRVVDQVGTAGDAVAFLESPAAKSLFDRVVDRRTLVLQRVLRSLQSSIILIILGVAVFILRGQFTGEESLGLLVVGTLALALGIAFLLAAGVSYALSRRWGLLDKS